MGLLSMLIEEDAEKLSTEKIKSFKGTPIAEALNAKLFIEFLELAGFKFLKFKLFSTLEINTFKGCKVVFTSSNQEIFLDSDTMEIVTFSSKKLKIGLTEFDVDLPDDLMKMFTNEKLMSITIIHRKNGVQLRVINQKHLLDLVSE